MTRKAITLIALCFVVAELSLSLGSRASAETGDDLFNRYFANVLDGAPCYARTYDDQHLKSHAAQKVRSIEVDLSKHNADGSPNSSEKFELGFAVMTRRSPEWFGQTASCHASDSAFDCYLEGDGGLFRLTPTADGLKFETGENGIDFEGTEALELSGKTGDDRVFDLAPAKEECAAASAFFDTGNQ